MRQAKFSLTNSQMEFLARHKDLGFKDKSALVRKALESYRANAERELLERSARLYASIYEEDSDLQQITDSALDGWPE